MGSDPQVVSISGEGQHVPPFAVQSDYKFEPEFAARPPRPIPAEIRSGPFGRGRRRMIVAWMLSGFLCIAIGSTKVASVGGLYFLPLAYLSWIGVACIGIGALIALRAFVSPGAYKYIERGQPIACRIRALVLHPSAYHDGQPSMYRYMAAIEYRDPVLGQLSHAECPSPDFATKDNWTVSYRVGEYATAVSMPGEAAPVLYGFLKLRSGLGLVRRKGEKPGRDLLKLVAAIIAIFAFFFALAWSLYAMGRYQPIDMSFSRGVIPFSIGAILIGVPFFGGIFWQVARENRQRAEANARAAETGEPFDLSPPRFSGVGGKVIAVLLVPGGLLLGGLISLCAAFTINALLDPSAGVDRPVEITDMVQVTHEAVFREYKIKYRFVGESEEQELLSTPSHMEQFTSPFALAEVHDGALGWKWVQTLRPLVSRDDVERMKQ